MSSTFQHVSYVSLVFQRHAVIDTTSSIVQKPPGAEKLSARPVTAPVPRTQPADLAMIASVLSSLGKSVNKTS